MAKGFTYTATAADGTPIFRYSAGHVKATYTHAVVDKGMTGNACFTSRLDLARARASEAHRLRELYAVRSGKPVPAFPEIVELTATPGRVRGA